MDSQIYDIPVHWEGYTNRRVRCVAQGTHEDMRPSDRWGAVHQAAFFGNVEALRGLADYSDLLAAHCLPLATCH